jgi:hypothetical protein
MTPEEQKAFTDCIDLFTHHKYGACHDAALQLIPKHMFQWLVQIMIISLERDYRFDLLEKLRTFAQDAFSHSDWAGLLFSLSFRNTSYEQVRAAADDSNKACQALFYWGQVLLTEGDRTAAANCFQSCVDLDAECAEAHMASAELLNFELIEQTLGRAIVRIADAVKDRNRERTEAAFRVGANLIENAARRDDFTSLAAVKCFSGHCRRSRCRGKRYRTR